MKNRRIMGLLLIILAICLIIVNWRMYDYYRESAGSIILILVILFAYIPAIIASLFVMTDGWILKRFIDPIDYGDWDKSKK